jgi:aspartate/methionine/tyrosine aminotransferase
MENINPQAEILNNVIKSANEAVYRMLTKRGKKIFFPKKGILGQTADAKDKAINATIGIAVEDDNSPMRLASLESQVNLKPGNVFPYAPSFGRLDIRQKWKDMMYEKNPSLKGQELSLPVVTNALTHALSVAGYLFMRKKDPVLVSDLYWGNYNLIFTHAYGSPVVRFRLFDGNSFDLRSFEHSLRQIESKKKIILLNFPNNPAGYTPSEEEVKGIVRILKTEAERGIRLVVITDDAYFGLVYEKGVARESIFASLAGLHENLLAVKVDGPTKEDYVWGLRVGFITYGTKNGSKELYEALAAKTGGAVRGNISNACNLSQSMLLNAYTSPSYQQEKDSKYKILESRFKKVKEVLKDKKFEKYFIAYPFNSGYFMCVKLREGLDGESIRHILLDKYDTGIINLNNVIRIAFSAAAEKDIPQLFENLYNACIDSEKK